MEDHGRADTNAHGDIGLTTPSPRRIHAAVGLIPTLLLALVLGRWGYLEFLRLHDQYVAKLDRISEEMRDELIRHGVSWEGGGSFSYPSEKQNEVNGIVDRHNKRREEVKPPIFARPYFASVLGGFGCRLGVAVAALWPIGICLIGHIKNRIEPALLILLSGVAGGMICQAVTYYASIVGFGGVGRSTGGALNVTVVGAVIGLIVGLGIGFMLEVSGRAPRIHDPLR